MNRDRRVIELGKRFKENFGALSRALADAAPEDKKEAIQDKLNAIADELAKLGAWDLP